MIEKKSDLKENEGTKIKKVTSDNITTEHICCAITESKTDRRVETKKVWMKERFADGLTFLKLDVRGKVFIEYIPVEHAWCPVEANDYLFMNCFWVSGQYKGKGHADRLLTACIEDAKAMGKKGLVALSSQKKMPFLSDPKYLKYKGFKTCDRAEPFFELLVLSFEEEKRENPLPRFKDCCKEGLIGEKILTLYYTNQCPHAQMYAEIFRSLAKDKNVLMNCIHLKTKEEARQAPSPFTTYSLFFDGKFVTNEILSEKKIREFLEKINPS